MNAITKNIPNSITCLNLLSGCFACLFAYKGEYDIVALCIGLSALFDFLDGMAARLLHAYSPMGKELDSLADLISFGLAPGFMAMHFMLYDSVFHGINDSYRLLSHSLLFPIDFGDSHVFFKIQELEVKRKLSSLFDFNRCRNFPYLFRTGRPRRNNRLVYNIIAVDSQEALTTKTERFLF